MNEIDKWNLTTCIHLFPADLTASPKGSLSDQQWYTRLVGTCRGKGFRGWFSRKTCKWPQWTIVSSIQIYIYIYIHTNRICTDTYLRACPSFDSVYGSNLLKIAGFRRQMAPRVPALPKVRSELHTQTVPIPWKGTREWYLAKKKHADWRSWLKASPKISSFESFDQIHAQIESTLKVHGLEAEYTSCQRKFETSVGPAAPPTAPVVATADWPRLRNGQKARVGSWELRLWRWFLQPKRATLLVL